MAIELEQLPQTTDTEITVRVAQPRRHGCERLYLDRGSAFITVEPHGLDGEAADLCGADPGGYQATWLGWHRGQAPAFAPTPRAAAEALIKRSN
jgi:hypothetical protein